MIPTPFVSYAQNAEDVVLYRALGSVSAGRYVEVGANHPCIDSVSRAFYDGGWSGITIEPVAYFADLQRAERPRDHQVQAAITSSDRAEITLHVVEGTGLSTIVDGVSERHTTTGIEHVDVEVPAMRLDDVLTENGFSGQEIHFMLIDVEGAEHDVLQSVDLRHWRPWVLVVEATLPNSDEPSHDKWEPSVLDSGYQLCLFDGLSRFYVADEHAPDLKQQLSVPANVLDKYLRYQDLETSELAKSLTDEVIRWRSVALSRWADAVSRIPKNDHDRALISSLRTELDATHRTISWRVTAPLRNIRKLFPR